MYTEHLNFHDIVYRNDRADKMEKEKSRQRFSLTANFQLLTKPLESGLSVRLKCTYQKIAE